MKRRSRKKKEKVVNVTLRMPESMVQFIDKEVIELNTNADFITEYDFDRSKYLRELVKEKMQKPCQAITKPTQMQNNGNTTNTQDDYTEYRDLLNITRR